MDALCVGLVLGYEVSGACDQSVLLLYSGGISAFAAERYETVKMLLLECHCVLAGNSESLIFQVNPTTCFGYAGDLLSGATPGSDWLLRKLKDDVGFLGVDRYENLFDGFEKLLAMNFWVTYPGNFAPLCRYRNRVSAGKLPDEVRDAGEEWAPLKVGMFGGSLETAIEAAEAASRMNPR